MFIPPDTDGAAGPNHLVIAINDQVRIQTKTGGVVSVQSLDSFWSSVLVSGTSSFDPHILFDEDSQRFILISVAVNFSNMSNSAVLLAVSATSDPTGAWYRRNISAVTGGESNWADFPLLGVNQNWIAVTVNMFSIAGGETFQYAKIIAIPKSQAVTSGSITPIVQPSGFNGSGFALTPALTYGNQQDLYFVDNQAFFGTGSLPSLCPTADALRISKLTGPANNPAWQAIGCVGPTTDFNVQPNAPQASTTTLVDTGDPRTINAVYRNGSLWTTFGGGLPASNPTRASVFWYKIDPTAPSVSQSGVIDDSSGNVFYSYPSIAVDNLGNAVLGFTGYSSQMYPSAYYAGMRAGGGMSAPVQFMAGQQMYTKDFGGGDVRWGDYSATVTDPATPGIFWTLQEYSAFSPNGFGCPNGNDTLLSDQSCWATRWAELTFDAPITAAPTVGAASVGYSSITWTWTSVANARSYNIYYATSPATLIANVAAPPFLLGGLVPSTTYSIEVAGVNGLGQGPLGTSPNVSTRFLPPPQVVFTAPAAGALLSGTISVVVYTNESVTGVQYKLDGANLGGQVSVSPFGTSWNTALSADGVHTLSAVAHDDYGHAGSAAVTVTVDNAPPVISGVASTVLSTGSVSIAWSTNKIADTQIEYGPNASYGTLTPLNTTLATAHAVSLGGLPTNTLFHYRVRSRGASGILGVSGDLTFTTLARPAVAASPTGVGVSAVTANWSASDGNPVGTQYFAEIASDAGFAAVLANSGWAAAFSFPFAGLPSNTRYFFRVRSRNGASVETTPVSLPAIATFANIPRSPAVLSVTYSSVTAQWTPLPASPQSARAEAYRFDVSQSPSFASGIVSATTADGLASQSGIVNLESFTTYYLRVGSLNVDGVANFVSFGSTRTLFAANAKILITNDQSLRISLAPDSPQVTNITVQVPQYSLPSGVTLKVTTGVMFSLPPSRSNEAPLTPLGPTVGVDISAGGSQPVSPVTIYMTYDPTKLGGSDPRTIRLASFAPSANQWSILPTNVDTRSYTISAITPHFSLFAPFFTAAGTSLDNVQVFPIPWEPGSNGSLFDAPGVTFTSLPANASVKIYSLQGELIWQGQADLAGVLLWAGDNRYGHGVATGTYLAVIDGGGQRTTRRVVVVR